MKNVYAKATFLILAVSLVRCSWPAQAADDFVESDRGLPNVDKGFSVTQWEFKETDGHLWLHFHPLGDKDNNRLPSPWVVRVQLAGVDTKFVPLVYFKGNEEERKKQKEINDAIAAFIAEQLKGKTVWIEDARPGVFAGPFQVLGVVWFDADRKQSLQQLLVKKGLAVKQCIRRAQAVDDVKESDRGLPKVETDFSVVDPLRDFALDDAESFATMISPKSIKRIILLRDHGFDAEQKIRTDADRLFAQLVKSDVRSKPWGLDAMERTVAECLVVTKKGDIFKVAVLGQLLNAKGAVTGVLLYGKGFSRRFDFRESPLLCGTHD